MLHASWSTIAPLTRREQTHMPELAAFVRRELENRGWSEAQLAARASLPRATLNNFLNNPEIIPRLENLAALAGALDVPLARLVRLCGFEVGPVSSDALEELEATLPELQFLRNTLSQLRKQDREAIVAFARGVVAAQQQHESPEVNQPRGRRRPKRNTDS